MSSDSTRKYQNLFQIAEIPRLSFNDPGVEKLLSESRPVVIEDTNLVTSALKWDIPYLEKNIGEALFTVFVSDSHKFKYYDDNKIKNMKGEFEHPFIKEKMTFPEFAEKMKQWKPGDKWLYLQTPLNSNIGPSIVKDFLAFNWSFLNNFKSKLEWGELTSNLILISRPGTVTPLHYDEQENFFSQLHGSKRFLLFPPDQFECLYPHPVFHPHDRQSQVNFDAPDLDKFPKFKDAVAHEAVLKPGDVLYIPFYWWHYVESVHDCSYSVSVNFWYKSSSKLQIEYPLTGQQKVAMMRNVEKILLDALIEPTEVSQLLRTLVNGRF